VAGWSAGTNLLSTTVGTDFGVNIAVELPDRVENYRMADYYNFSPYEYINQVSATIRFNPDVVMPGQSGSVPNEDYGLGDSQLTQCRTYCDTAHDSWEYFGDYIYNYSGQSDGWVAVANRVSSSHQFSSWFGSGTIYQTLQGGKVVNPYVPMSIYPNARLAMHAGHKGVAKFNVGVGGTLTCTYYMYNTGSSMIVQEGPDPDPDIPLTLIYFTTVGTGGSPILIDTFADWSFFQWIYTGAEFAPGGKANDDYSYCWPIGSCPATGSNTIIEAGTEKTNYNIGQSGESAAGYISGGNYIRGGVQFWGVHLCVQ
jgi:hypothetical protein